LVGRKKKRRSENRTYLCTRTRSQVSKSIWGGGGKKVVGGEKVKIGNVQNTENDAMKRGDKPPTVLRLG